MTEIANAVITDVSLTMADHGYLTFNVHVNGGGWGCNIGGYGIGKGYLGAKDFEADGAGLEAMMRIMDTVGVDSWEKLKGKYIRVELNGLGSTVSKIGNILNDKWIDLREFFEQRSKNKDWKDASVTLPLLSDDEPVDVLVVEDGDLRVGQFGAYEKHFGTFEHEFYVDGEASTGVTHWMYAPHLPQETIC